MKTGGKLGRDAMAAIGKQLRELYGDVIAEGVPERFAEILTQLDAPPRCSGSTKVHLDSE
jgi:hypothetical protein